MTLTQVSPLEKPHQAMILSGWKDIATYLGRGVRTVQRYERDLRLPIRRPAGTPTGTVIAKKTEIDAWIDKSPIRKMVRLSFRAVDNSEGFRKLGLLVTKMRELGEMTTQLRKELSTAREALTITRKLLRENLQEQGSGSSKMTVADFSSSLAKRESE